MTKAIWSSNNINLTLYDKHPLWDTGDSYTRYMEDDTNSRYNISISCINARTETRNLSCYLTREARYLKRRDSVVQTANHPEYGSWWNDTFNVWAKQLKQTVELDNMEFIHPVLFGIPTLKKQSGFKGPAMYMESPNIIAAFRYRVGKDTTQHFWKIYWRYYDPQDKKTYMIEFRIDSDNVIRLENSGDVSRRVSIAELMHFPIELFTAVGYDAGNETHKKQADEQINLHNDFIKREQHVAEQYSSKFANVNHRDNIKNIAIAWAAGELELSDNDIIELQLDLEKFNICYEDIFVNQSDTVTTF